MAGPMLNSRVPRKLLSALAGVVALFALPVLSSAVDREELGRVIAMIPPDEPPEEYGNVVYRRLAKKKGMAPVVFQHWSHRARYTCRVCHLELEFGMRRGSSGIPRELYSAGAFCGVCHNGTIAFSAADSARQCDRCHVRDRAPLKKAFERFADGLPEASHGNRIDWAKAIAQGTITPRNSLSEKPPAMALPATIAHPLKLGDARSRSEVTFSHAEHFAEMDCSNCHPEIFNIKKKGTELFSMDRSVFGLFCGSCHMRVAFPMNDCRRCHPGMSSYRR
jgi:c(7)-type cytochrome triheme protein